MTLVGRLQPLIRGETLYEGAYEALKTALVSGRLPPGQSVSLRSLAAELKVSPMPVRDAINRLVTQGALQTLPSRSVRVPIMTRARFDEITEIRCFLEGKITERAVSLIEPATLQALATFDNLMNRASARHQIDAYLRENFKFHLTLYRSSKCEVMLPIVDGLWLQVGPFLTEYLKQAGFRKANTHHGRIIAALKTGDAKAARTAVVADIQEAAVSARCAL